MLFTCGRSMLGKAVPKYGPRLHTHDRGHNLYQYTPTRSCKKSARIHEQGQKIPPAARTHRIALFTEFSPVVE